MTTIQIAEQQGYTAALVHIANNGNRRSDYNELLAHLTNSGRDASFLSHYKELIEFHRDDSGL